MDIRRFPLELLERIFQHLDTQALAACALADPYLATIVYSSHFLDEYCRRSLSCSWVTAADICNACISVPYEFWFWAHTTTKVEDYGKTHIYFHSGYLTKIGTLKHMYIMWLMCGITPGSMYSFSELQELYDLPDTVMEVFDLGTDPGPAVKDCLLKIFLGLPEIMELTCGNLKVFRMQCGGTSTLQMDLVCNDGIKPKLPLDFDPLFSVEIILSSLFGRHPSILILIGKDVWVLWLGYLNISFDNNETTIIDNSFCKYFRHEDLASDIRYYAYHALLDMNGYVANTKNGAVCPIISGQNSDMISLCIEIAQNHHCTLQLKFSMLLAEGSRQLVDKVLNCCRRKAIPGDETVMDILKHRVSYSLEINEFVMDTLKTNLDRVMFDTSEQLNYLVYKCIMERVACLFRNEIQFCTENRFCHSFLCGCVEFPMDWKEQKFEMCLSEKARWGLDSPCFWPPHVLSAACRAVPVLLEVLEADIMLIASRSVNYVIPDSVQAQTNERLHDASMCLTNRPPGKPRCPPLLTQVRLWSTESS